MDGCNMDLPVRKKIRLDGHDYSSCGTYFVTVCTIQRYALLWEEGFGKLETPVLSQVGEIIRAAIQQISTHYDNVKVDRYCIMPDHVHLIVIIHPDGNIPCSADLSAQKATDEALLKVIGSMKRWVSRQLGYSIWQKSFHERIIRNHTELVEVRQYIQDNPRKYANDPLVP